MNLQMEKTSEYWILEQKCKVLLEMDGIRFAGIIGPMGRLVAGGFKEGIKPFVDDADAKKMYMELVLRVSMRKDFDYSLGPVKYAASRREKVVLMSFPISSNVLLISAEPNVEIDETAHKIMKMVGLG